MTTQPRKFYDTELGGDLPSHPSPVTDMTAKEYFTGEGSPLTLDNICTPEERDFLLDHIELYAKGKVHQAAQQVK